MTSLLARQHLIDPEICIRCNTCEEACTKGAITHDARNYAINFDGCDACGACLPPCPTGAIDSWRRVSEPYSVALQLGWDALPDDSSVPEAPTEDEVPLEVRRLTDAATHAQGGPSAPPWSAAHPYIGLYSPERPARATVAGNYRLTAEDAEVDIRHIVLELGKVAFPVLEGQSLGVVPPGLNAAGRPHHVRLYSIASPRNGERSGHNNVALTVKRVTKDHEGRPVRGVASNYLCDLARGSEVSLTGPYGSSFLMPNHPGAKLLMICTGTGAAPMRAMTERRRRRLGLREGAQGEILLFFGARKQSELPYFGPLMKLPKELIEVELAFSREPGRPKEYVQDRIVAREEVVGRWLRDADTFLYLCGHKRMEAGVMEALRSIAESCGLDWASLFARLKSEGRLHIETY